MQPRPLRVSDRVLELVRLRAGWISRIDGDRCLIACDDGFVRPLSCDCVVHATPPSLSERLADIQAMLARRTAP